VTGAVLKKARARMYLGRLTSVYVLCLRPRGMRKQPHQERRIQHRLDVFQVTAGDFGVERRSTVEGDNRIRWSRSSRL